MSFTPIKFHFSVGGILIDRVANYPSCCFYREKSIRVFYRLPKCVCDRRWAAFTRVTRCVCPLPPPNCVLRQVCRTPASGSCLSLHSHLCDALCFLSQNSLLRLNLHLSVWNGGQICRNSTRDLRTKKNPRCD